jgi:predicted secreted protein
MNYELNVNFGKYMNFGLKTAFCIGLACFIYLNCFGMGSNPNKNLDTGLGLKSNVKIIQMSDSSSVIHLAVGETLAVRLSSIPGTGYDWQIESIDSVLVSFISRKVIESGNRKVVIGGPEMFEWRFRANLPGKTTLKMVYKRSWEKDIPPLHIFIVFLDITQLDSTHKK